ncbi:methyltransferase family protein [Haloarchaeobius sp. TZWWS8]|uniref:methyltransferase family protein n=1 Tax=Haloarchaeobius sp. TZWWS8 TaxID=3446121 RepID=UPI003EB93A6A
MLHPELTLVLFGVGGLAAGGVYTILLVTLLTDRRLWPPGEKSPAYYLHWAFVNVFNVCLLGVAILDWDTWVLPRGVLPVVGAALAGVGIVIFVTGARAMEKDETMGVTGDLYTEGAYAYSRNPQYVGMLIGLVGFTLLCNSALVAVLAGAHFGWVLLLPRAEEPHLASVYGTEYRSYRRRTPRFVDGRTVRRLLR